jgi:uncharacterized membrane protein YfcA
VGVASLLSFPILLAVGLPPAVANAFNTIGLVPAGGGGAPGFRRELRLQPGLTCLPGTVFAVAAEVDRVVVALLAVSSVGGGYLGERIARRLPATVLRVAGLLAGGTAAVALLV